MIRSLSELRESEFAASKKLVGWAYGLPLVAAVLAVLSARGIASESLGGWVSRVFVVVLPIAASLVRSRGRAAYGRAERLRVLELVQVGLGTNPSELELSELAYGTGVRVGAPKDDAFATTEPPGGRKLTSCIRESAFYTERLARTCKACAGALLITVVAAIGIALWVSVQVRLDAQTGTWLATVAGICLVSTSTGTVVSAWRTFGAVQFAARDVVTQATQRLEVGETSREQALLLMDRYSRALATADPVPDWIYRWRKPRIATAFAQLTRVATESPGESKGSSGQK